MVDLSCAFATSMATPDHVAAAEALGYRRAWLYDSPALYPDVWMMLAECARRTSTIEIGPGRLAVELVEASLTAPGAGTSKKKPLRRKREWQDYMEIWRRRERNHQAALQSATFVTPTSLKRQEQEITEAAVTTQAFAQERTPAMLIGELAHQFLEN